MMAQRKDRETGSDLPPGVGKPALRALTAAGYSDLEQFTKVKESDLQKLHGVGPKAIGVIRSALHARGLAFTESDREATGSKAQVFDSPTGWVRSHIQEYVKSDGKKGHRWRGLPTLLLTTLGRKTGTLRRTALIYGRDGSNYLIVASNGGAPDHPLWYLNLVKTAEAEIQVGADKLVIRARTATAKDRPRLWQLMTGIFPHYDKDQAKAAKAGRDIPIVILEPVG